MPKVLHIANPDKFSIPLCNLVINNEILQEHKFLFISDAFDKSKYPQNRVYNFDSPIRKHLFKNLYMFYKLCREADVILIHGAQIVIFFFIFPWFTKKLAWAIQGCDLYDLVDSHENLFRYITKFVLKRVRIHPTHIEGDSVLANRKLGSNAKFFYSPVYLSNVVDTSCFLPKEPRKTIKILVGNSTSPINDHLTIFNKLKTHEHLIEKIICPLSYGIYIDYKNHVIKEGKALFGDKFQAIEEFMPVDKYKEFLKEFDLAVFNHDRQEAMGVTLTLLALGKPVFVNPNTTSFASLKRRGFKIFDNNDVFINGPALHTDVLENKNLLEKYYSVNTLITSLQALMLNPNDEKN